MKTKYLLFAGSGIPIVFFATTIICGLVMGGYSHIFRMVSELGAIGSRSHYIFSFGLILCSVLSVAFVMGLCRVCRQIGISVIPAIIILSFSVSIAGAAIFPLPLRMHLIMGMPSVLLVLSPLMSLLLWRGTDRPFHSALMPLLSSMVMSLGFLAFIPGLWGDYPGLKQRFFHIGWSIWFFLLSYRFARLLEREGIDPSDRS
jgi:hypothetical membrane protein